MTWPAWSFSAKDRDRLIDDDPDVPDAAQDPDEWELDGVQDRSQTMTLMLVQKSLLTANSRLHWAVRADRTRCIRHMGRSGGRRKLTPVTTRQRVTVTYQFPDRRRRDAENLAPTSKAIVDGLRDVGVLPDDDTAHVVGVDSRIGDPIPPNVVPLVRVTVRLEDA